MECSRALDTVLYNISESNFVAVVFWVNSHFRYFRVHMDVCSSAFNLPTLHITHSLPIPSILGLWGEGEG